MASSWASLAAPGCPRAPEGLAGAGHCRQAGASAGQCRGAGSRVLLQSQQRRGSAARPPMHPLPAHRPPPGNCTSLGLRRSRERACRMASDGPSALLATVAQAQQQASPWKASCAIGTACKRAAAAQGMPPPAAAAAASPLLPTLRRRRGSCVPLKLLHCRLSFHQPSTAGPAGCHSQRADPRAGLQRRGRRHPPPARAARRRREAGCLRGAGGRAAGQRAAAARWRAAARPRSRGSG